MAEVQYTADNIRSLDWKEHIRLRPGMYIGKLGNGKSPDDGIYILIKEIVDNAIDEFVMDHGRRIDITVRPDMTIVRDYGRGIPLEKVVDCVSRINTGGKYDSKAFKKSVGLNGVGTKAVNALSAHFEVRSFREGQCKKAIFRQGELIEESLTSTSEKNGTYVEFIPDSSIFQEFSFDLELIEEQLWNYAYLNSGLSIHLNGEKIQSKNGLLDLLNNKTSSEDTLYDPIHIRGEDIEIALTHGRQYGEQFYSFVNGQNTTQGGTHLAAYRESLVAAIRNHFNKNYEAADIRTSMIGAISVRVEEPVFESQTKTKLGSTHIAPDGQTIRTFVNDFIKRELDNYLHRHPEVAEVLHNKIKQSERERKEIAGIKQLANKRAKTANLHNKKLRDCRIHKTSKNKDEEARKKSMIFITEGDSASGSLTKARDVQHQAIFSLRGKPLNCYSLTKKIVYENEEFNLLQHALQIENGLDGLRYEKVIIATDADVDGMHIRLLLLTFFLQFFPDLVREGHLFILDTPLFRVRDKQHTYYCYSEKEKQQATAKLRGKPEITRFKGLGEISPLEFKQFIGEDIRLEPVRLKSNANIEELLSYYMGKNTKERQEFIIDNLRFEEIPLVEQELTEA